MNRVHAVVAAAVLAALAPSSAFASTWTVDDDKADCPNARFTSIQAAVDQAAPWDTVVVCPGLYLEQSIPSSGNNSPSQTGSRNGLTITKPLTIKGAGASKVTIRPAAALGASLAGTAPYLRDGGGNVVTVSRQSGGASDDNEMFVDISGVTIESPSAYAESALAFFNASGSFANAKIGTIGGTGPYSYGVVMTNSLQGAEAGIRREVTLEKSLITGGVFFDDARGDRRRHDDHRALGHQGLRHDHRLPDRRTGHVHLRPARVDQRQRDHRAGDPDRRRDRARPGEPGRPRVQRDRLEPARRPDQHRRRRRAGLRQLLGHRHHDRPGRAGHVAR